MTYTIVVGTDGSDNAQRAVEVAADLASRLGGEVVLVHTFEPLAHLDRLGPDGGFSEVEAQVTETLENEWAAPVRDRDVGLRTRVAHGSPAEVLLDLADEEDADLIAVGARGIGRLQMLTMGSTSSKVVQASTRPVLVVPTPG